MRKLVAAAAIAAAFVSSAGCRRQPPAPRLVLLYAPCTVNRDSLSPYAPGVLYTPHLAAFARESVVFARHQSETDQSGPAYASILSGAQVDRHGVYRHPARLDDRLQLLAETFAANGYETHFWSGHPMASAQLNYGQGVRPENVHERRPGVADLYALTANDADFAAILGRLRRDRSLRVFVQVAFTITHGPYTPVDPRAVADFRREYPAEWPAIDDAEAARLARLYTADYLRWQWDYPEVARERGLTPDGRRRLAAVVGAYYKVSVRLLDHCFGRLVDSVRDAGLLDESLIAFTADHGETLDRESALFKWTHGAEITPESIEVPLIVRLPGRAPRSGRYEGVTRSIDLHPTLAGLAGLRAPRAASLVDGVDLSAALAGRAPVPRLSALSHGTLMGPELLAQFRGWLVARYHPSTAPDHMWVAVREGDRYTRLRRLEDGAWGFDQFDLAHRPLAAPLPLDPQGEQRAVARELEGYKAFLLARYAEGGAAPTPPEAEARERLRALGYIQ